eukprot:16878-Heterococcus_DN1.PRE.1
MLCDVACVRAAAVGVFFHAREPEQYNKCALVHDSSAKLDLSSCSLAATTVELALLAICARICSTSSKLHQYCTNSSVAAWIQRDVSVSATAAAAATVAATAGSHSTTAAVMCKCASRKASGQQLHAQLDAQGTHACPDAVIYNTPAAASRTRKY